VVALEYAAVLDTATGTHFTDITYDLAGNYGHFNNFFDLWDDENALIEHFDNNAISLNQSGNWTGSFVYSGGAGGHGTGQDAAVITLRDSSITANGSNCVTDYNSNGLYIDNTICQASGPWQVFIELQGKLPRRHDQKPLLGKRAYLNPYEQLQALYAVAPSRSEKRSSKARPVLWPICATLLRALADVDHSRQHDGARQFPHVGWSDERRCVCAHIPSGL